MVSSGHALSVELWIASTRLVKSRPEENAMYDVQHAGHYKKIWIERFTSEYLRSNYELVDLYLNSRFHDALAESKLFEYR